ncbi:MAG TPA: heat-shock protein Hsp15 [candidate division Zixibacteria bacterium]|nr:heat-shock protein Hsp15 [candidate division Zixibacteria bacterium]
MRLDRFLSVAKIFKSRSLAALAIDSSMVFIDSLIAKAAREVRPGQIIEIDTPRFYKKIEVILLPGGNISKKEASSLYKLLEERFKD